MNPPVQTGHVALVRHFSPKYHSIWVLPVYQHIFDSKQNLEPFKHRFMMCKLAFAHIKNVIVKDLERVVTLNHNGNRIATIDVINYLQKVCR